jgi:hypothetical protein
MTIQHRFPLLPTCALIATLWTSALPAQTLEPKLPPSLPSPQILPDLVVSRIEFVGGVYLGNCNRIGVTITNAGNSGVTAPVTVRLTTAIPVTEATPASIDRQHTAGLAAGASATLFFDPYALAIDPTQVQVFINAQVDPSNEIIELNESNNLRAVEQAVLATRTNCPVVSVTGGSALEGSPVAFSVTVDKRFPRDISVSYATANGTAVAGACSGGGDYLARSGTLRFPASTDPRPQIVSVSTCQDLPNEANEGFTLRLSNPVNATVRPSQAAGTIQNRPAT